MPQKSKRRSIRRLSSSSSSDGEIVLRTDQSERFTPNPSIETVSGEISNVLREFTQTLRSNQMGVQQYYGELLPIFDPKESPINVEEWIRKVDELASIYNWTEEVTVHNALIKLKGLASTWYSSLRTTKYSWHQWCTLLTEAFPPESDFHLRLQTMMKRVKREDETYLRYYYEKLALVNHCGIIGKEAVSCIIAGITNPMVKTGAKAGNHNDPSSLLAYLQSCNSGLDTLRQVNGNSGRAYKKVRRQSSDMSDGEEPKAPPSQNRKEERAESRVCFNCKKPGHVIRNCTERVVLKRRGSREDSA